MRELTTELLERRVLYLWDKIHKEHELDQDSSILFEKLICDNCGLTEELNKSSDGWHTDGSFEDGWRDLCPKCSLELIK